MDLLVQIVSPVIVPWCCVNPQLDSVLRKEFAFLLVILVYLIISTVIKIIQIYVEVEYTLYIYIYIYIECHDNCFECIESTALHCSSCPPNKIFCPISPILLSGGKCVSRCEVTCQILTLPTFKNDLLNICQRKYIYIYILITK